MQVGDVPSPTGVKISLQSKTVACLKPPLFVGESKYTSRPEPAFVNLTLETEGGATYENKTAVNTFHALSAGLKISIDISSERSPFWKVQPEQEGTSTMNMVPWGPADVMS